MADEVRRVPVQIASKVLWRVRWHIGRKQTSFRTVLVQMAGEVPEGSGSEGGEVADGSGAESRQSC